MLMLCWQQVIESELTGCSRADMWVQKVTPCARSW